MKKDYAGYAPGSVLIEMGSTKVICTAMPDNSVPRFLLNSGTGWVTAEYDMLPSATPTRYPREARRGGIKGRTSEIQRLIGRSLRAGIDLAKLGERTIHIDCDVLEADGGTRTASVNGGFVALYSCCQSLVRLGALETNPIEFFVGAMSVGIVEGEIVVDLDYEKDSMAEVDMNVVMDELGRIIEIQGTAEHKPFARARLNKMVAAAADAIKAVIEEQKRVLGVEDR
jgi:ribonuclease PH